MILAHNVLGVDDSGVDKTGVLRWQPESEVSS